MKAVHCRPILPVLAMLVAVALFPMAGCGGKKVSTEVDPSAGWFDDLNKRIVDEFDDAGKIGALSAVVDRMDATMTELDRDVVAYYAKIDSLNRDYGATREQFQELTEQFNARQESAFKEMVTHISEAKKIAGRDGWKKLTDIDESLYKSWQRGL